jgi:hypothetical protein
MLSCQQACEACDFIRAQPSIDGIRIAWLQQPLPCDIVGYFTVGNFQHGSTPFTYVWAWVMIACVQQLLALRRGQR